MATVRLSGTLRSFGKLRREDRVVRIRMLSGCPAEGRGDAGHASVPAGVGLSGTQHPPPAPDEGALSRARNDAPDGK